MTCRRHGSYLHLAILVLLVLFPIYGSAESDIWSDLRKGGHVVMLRHALAPGTGDPENFRVGDCSTQRNLSDSGREQARKIGQKFRENGITRARVVSSQWCRCIETAELLELGPVGILPVLNSIHQRPERKEPQTHILGAWLRAQPLDLPLILVSHRVNISAFSGAHPDSGEMVVLKRQPDGTWQVAGQIETPH